MGYKAIVKSAVIGRFFIMKPLIYCRRRPNHRLCKKSTNDGKIDLRRDPSGRSRIPPISTAIIEKLQNSEGILPYNDTSSPASIRAEFDTSKKL